MARIVISEFMADAAVDRLAAVHDVTYDPALVDNRNELTHLLADADALIVRNRTDVDITLLDAGPNLHVVGRLGVGLDNIDVAACEDRGIAVRPATGANAASVAEYVMAATLMLIRGVFLVTPQVASGEWPRTSLKGLEIAGRTMGLIGYGDIAQRVARQAVGFGMEVIAYDPYLSDGHEAWNIARSASLEDVLASADAVSIHVPLTDETRNLIDREVLEAMRPAAVLINTSRGGIVDENALVDALRSGSLRGAALDVFSEEPVTADAGARFRDVPNLVLTPHVAGVTQESNERVSAMIADEVIAVVGDG